MKCVVSEPNSRKQFFLLRASIFRPQIRGEPSDPFLHSSAWHDNKKIRPRKLVRKRERGSFQLRNLGNNRHLVENVNFIMTRRACAFSTSNCLKW